MYIRKYYMLLCLLMPFMAWAKNDTLPVGKVSVSDTVPVSVRTLPNAFRAIAQPEIRQGDLFRGGETTVSVFPVYRLRSLITGRRNSTV